MDKKKGNKNFAEQFQEILFVLKRALSIYIIEGQGRIIENEEYKLYKLQYPFDEFYHFKEDFIFEWE